MKTEHKILFSDSRNMEKLKSETVDLIVTSPPYPMIEMWDGIFLKQNSQIRIALEKKECLNAFELMHKELDKVWNEVHRVLKNGGIACINIGDATRSLNGSFMLYSNHSRIINHCINIGFSVLPEILWRKQTNAPNKFMGSGMLPVGAYVTLEHEYILILRKGNKREFKNEKVLRQKSAFFWEERNIWFSDIWENLKGTGQKLNHKDLRERSGAYPFELAYRLINMYSNYGDTVLDPFLGTGTTTVASMCLARNSIGFEIDTNFNELIKERIIELKKFSKDYNINRLNNHLNFINERKQKNKEIKYNSDFYGFEVVTNQEKNIVLHNVEKINLKDNNNFEIEHKETKVEKELDLNAFN